MSKVIITDGQNLWDIAIQEYGTVEAVFGILEDNKTLDTLDVVIEAGDKIIVSDTRIVNKDFVNLNKQKQRRINTESGLETPTGIGAMKIGNTFIIT